MKVTTRLLIATILATLLGGTIYAIANLNDTYYFHSVANVCLLILLALMLCLAIYEGVQYHKRKDEFVPVDGWQPATKIVAIPSGILICLCGINFLWSGLSISISYELILLPILSLVVGITMVCGGVYAILCPVPNAKTQARDSLFGMAMPIGCVVRVLQLYFDKTTPGNASVKLFISFAYLVLAIYLLSDVRLTLGRAILGYHRALVIFAPTVVGIVALGEILSAFMKEKAFPYGVADILFFAVSFLLIYIRGTFTQLKQEIEDHDIA